MVVVEESPHTRPLQDIRDCPPPYLVSEVCHCSTDPRVAPLGILLGHPDHEIPNLIGCWRTSDFASLGAPIVLPCDQLPVPCQQSLWRHQTGDVVAPKRMRSALRASRARPKPVNLHTEDFGEACEKVTAIVNSDMSARALRGTLSERLELAVAGKVEGGIMRESTAKVGRESYRSLIEAIGDIELGALSKPDIIKWYEWKARETSAATAHKQFRCLRGLCTWLVERGHLPPEPFTGVKVKGSRRTRREKFCTVEQRDMLIKLCTREDLRYVLYCGFHAGMRLHEIIESRSDWFSMKDGKGWVTAPPPTRPTGALGPGAEKQFPSSNKPALAVPLTANYIPVRFNMKLAKNMDAAQRTRYRAIQSELGVTALPSIALADKTGRFYAISPARARSVEAFLKDLKDLEELRKIRLERDASLALAEEATGIDRAKLLHNAMESLRVDLAVVSHKDIAQEIISLDADNSAGLQRIYETAPEEKRLRRGVRKGQRRPRMGKGPWTHRHTGRRRIPSRPPSAGDPLPKAAPPHHSETTRRDPLRSVEDHRLRRNEPPGKTRQAHAGARHRLRRHRHSKIRSDYRAQENLRREVGQGTEDQPGRGEEGWLPARKATGNQTDSPKVERCRPP